MLANKFHTHTEQRAILHTLYIQTNKLNITQGLHDQPKEKYSLFLMSNKGFCTAAENMPFLSSGNDFWCNLMGKLCTVELWTAQQLSGHFLCVVHPGRGLILSYGARSPYDIPLQHHDYCDKYYRGIHIEIKH